MTDINASDIEALVRIFDDSNWDELRVVIDGLELYLSKKPGDGHAALGAAPRALGAEALEAAKPARRSAPHPPSREAKADAVEIPPGMVAVRAPNLGTFYRAPKPGAPPYVTIGQTVSPDTEICLIEVMKLFTSVTSGVAGVVRKVLAEDSELVEFDQPLFLIGPLA
jgi:acetyl-CoA carboxylase biotin carboxyl carrier protein